MTLILGIVGGLVVLMIVIVISLYIHHTRRYPTGKETKVKNDNPEINHENGIYNERDTVKPYHITYRAELMESENPAVNHHYDDVLNEMSSVLTSHNLNSHRPACMYSTPLDNNYPRFGTNAGLNENLLCNNSGLYDDTLVDNDGVNDNTLGYNTGLYDDTLVSNAGLNDDPLAYMAGMDADDYLQPITRESSSVANNITRMYSTSLIMNNNLDVHGYSVSQPVTSEVSPHVYICLNE